MNILKNYRLIILPFVLIFSNKVYSSDTTKFEFFPEERLFPFLFLDPMECQFHGGIYYLNKESDQRSDIYSIVNMGISRPVLLFQPNNTRYELSFAQITY